MKSQDILILLKLASLNLHEKNNSILQLSSHWEDWEIQEAELLTQAGISFHYKSKLADAEGEQSSKSYFDSQRGVRALADSTGISKSEVSVALQRCYVAGLAIQDRFSGLPKVNASGLTEFIIHGLRYVFPVKPAELGRGIATAWAAPVLQGVLASGGDTPLIWPDARGNTKGQIIAPLFKTVPQAVKTDPHLYSLLALTDSIRIGMARERKIAADKLEQILKGAA